MLILNELYLGVIYIILLIIGKIEAIIGFFDTKPLRVIIKSRVIGYLLTMITFLV